MSKINPKKFVLRGCVQISRYITINVNVFQAESTAEFAKELTLLVTQFLQSEKLHQDLEAMFSFWCRTDIPPLTKMQIPGISIESNGNENCPSCSVHVSVPNPDWIDPPSSVAFYVGFDYEKGKWTTNATNQTYGSKQIPAEALELERRIRALRDEL